MKSDAIAVVSVAQMAIAHNFCLHVSISIS
jgi:hypothetical protein